jgi:hypothetical protein
MESARLLAAATFTPRETEQITGVTQATQRDWRRRELTSFPTRKGRKRFSSYDLAHLLVMKQLLWVFRPGPAYTLGRMSCRGPVHILAKRAYPKADIKIDGEAVEDVRRFVVYTRFWDGEAISIQHAADLDSLELEGRKSQYPVAFHLAVDHHEIADQLQLKQVKPYFLEVSTA